MICRVHHYSHKELLLRKAWEKEDTEFDGATLKILPDLSRATLQRRALLKPVLEVARQAGITYRWGFLISVTFKKAQQSFSLRTPAELLALFVFMEVDPIDVPDWLQLLQHFVPRPGGGKSEESPIAKIPLEPLQIPISFAGGDKRGLTAASSVVSYHMYVPLFPPYSVAPG